MVEKICEGMSVKGAIRRCCKEGITGTEVVKRTPPSFEEASEITEALGIQGLALEDYSSYGQTCVMDFSYDGGHFIIIAEEP